MHNITNNLFVTLTLLIISKKKPSITPIKKTAIASFEAIEDQILKLGKDKNSNTLIFWL